MPCTLTQRQQFDLPQPILSLGGRAKVLLLGMAQRQTLSDDMGETANHYHICLSYVGLSGTVVLSCRVADTCGEDKRSLAEGGVVDLGGLAAGRPARMASSTEGEKEGGCVKGLGERHASRRQEKKQGMRLLWVE